MLDHWKRGGRRWLYLTRVRAGLKKPGVRSAVSPQVSWSFLLTWVIRHVCVQVGLGSNRNAGRWRHLLTGKWWDFRYFLRLNAGDCLLYKQLFPFLFLNHTTCLASNLNRFLHFIWGPGFVMTNFQFTTNSQALHCGGLCWLLARNYSVFLKHGFFIWACLVLVKGDYFRLQCILGTLEGLMPVCHHTLICRVTIARWCPVFSSLAPAKQGTLKACVFSKVQLAGPKLDILWRLV